MREYTMEQLLEWYEEAVKDHEAAVEDQMFDDEEHDKIETLRHEVEEVADEIFRRKMESRASLPNA